ncbi:MAG TPA: ABC transporter ATP-binding protein [Aquabacterium sp.]|nr:ABC transporter ATP-binding protein [Aquabacterium sp.]
MSPATAVELDQASLTYPDGTVALQPVSLQIEPGQFVSLLGPSGCGKSTLLKLISGLLQPSTGQVLRLGQPAKLPDRGSAQARHLSYVFQDATLMPWADVEHNVRLPLDLAGTPRAEADERVKQVLTLVSLDGFARHKPHQLSGGMQMRVSIARSLITQPELLLMDEPFGALDEITRQKLDGELSALWLKQPTLTSVFVTHSIAEAVFLSQRVIVMAARPGRVIADLAITAPFPRDEDFRTSPDFNHWVRQLQHLMLHA